MPEDKRPPIPAEEERVEASHSAPAPSSGPQTPSPAAVAAASGDAIVAPLTGTLYRRPGAGKPDFAKEGDVVEAGTVICSVEAMKLMNDIVAPRKCRIVKFLAEHDANVVKGQPLVQID